MTTVETCAVHGVRHRAGSKAATACAQTTPAAIRPVDLIEVTVEHLRAVLTGWDATLIRIDIAGRPLLLVAPSWSAGEVLVDRHDVLVLLDHLGSLEAVAADLTLAVQWEQLAAVAA